MHAKTIMTTSHVVHLDAVITEASAWVHMLKEKKNISTRNHLTHKNVYAGIFAEISVHPKSSGENSLKKGCKGFLSDQKVL